MSTTIKIRRDTAVNWATNNPTPHAGELCIVTDATPQRLKIGDGVSAFNSLPYFTLPNATTSDAGLMSNLDKTKLNGIEANAINADSVLAMLYRPVAESIRATFVVPSDDNVTICTDRSTMSLIVVDGVGIAPRNVVSLEAGTHTIEYIVPSTHIIAGMFKDVKNMTDIHLPSWVHDIGDEAFLGCVDLMRVECEAMTPPTLGNDAFDPATVASGEAVVHSIVLTDYQGSDWATSFSSISTF